MKQFKISVKLNIESDQLIENHLNFNGVNYELNPIIHMTAPAEWKSKSLTQAPVNIKLFNSLILLFGFIPIDIHSLRLNKILKNGFRETSSSVLMKQWNHNREIESIEQGCVLTDEVFFSTRIPFLNVIVKPIYLSIFKRRHKRLIIKFGAGGKL